MKLFSTSYETIIETSDNSPENFLSVAAIVCEQLNWSIDYLSSYGLIAHTERSTFGKSYEVVIRKRDEEIVIKSSNTDNALTDFGKNKKLVNNFLLQFTEQEASLSKQEKTDKYTALKEKFVEGDDYLAPGVYEEMNKSMTLAEMFIPKASYTATPILAILNILVFIIMVIAGVHVIEPNGEAIYNWGGNYGPATLDGQWWRIITCSFVHIGIVHLLMNMYGLLYAGSLLEPLIGTQRFVVSYLLTAVTSSLLSLYWHPDIVSAGASGAIFGLFGLIIAMLTTNLLHKQVRKTLLPNMAIYVGYNLLYGMKEGVDNAGHIGGLVGGMIIGYAFYPTLKEGASIRAKNLTIGFLTLGTIGLAIIGFKVTPNDSKNLDHNVSVYIEEMERFSQLESKALALINDDSTASDLHMTQLRDSGVYYWDEGLKLLNGIGAMDLPPAILERNQMVVQYCNLRKETFELLYKQLAESTDIYQPKITELYEQTDSIIAVIQNDLDQNSAGK